MGKWIVEAFTDGQETVEAADIVVECDDEKEADSEYRRLCFEHPTATIVKRRDQRKLLQG